MPRKAKTIHDRPKLPSIEQVFDEAVVKLGFIIGYYFTPRHEATDSGTAEIDQAIRKVLITLVQEASR